MVLFPICEMSKIILPTSFATCEGQMKKHECVRLWDWLLFHGNQIAMAYRRWEFISHQTVLTWPDVATPWHWKTRPLPSYCSAPTLSVDLIHVAQDGPPLHSYPCRERGNSDKGCLHNPIGQNWAMWRTSCWKGFLAGLYSGCQHAWLTF